jgi:hypothetical protein
LIWSAPTTTTAEKRETLDGRHRWPPFRCFVALARLFFTRARAHILNNN